MAGFDLIFASGSWDAYISNPVVTPPAARAVAHIADAVKEKAYRELIINIHWGAACPSKWRVSPQRLGTT